MSTIDEIMDQADDFARAAIAAAEAPIGQRRSTDAYHDEERAELYSLIAAALADAYRSGAESMRAEAMDCAVNAGRGSLAEEIAAIPTPSPGALPTGGQS